MVHCRRSDRVRAGSRFRQDAIVLCDHDGAGDLGDQGAQRSFRQQIDVKFHAAAATPASSRFALDHQPAVALGVQSRPYGFRVDPEGRALRVRLW